MAAKRGQRISVVGRGADMLSAREDPRTPARLLRSGMTPGGQPLPGAFEIAIEQVVPDPDQPRRDWGHSDGETRLQQLAASIRQFGILQPLLVRPDGKLPDGRPRFIIINGGRRRAAAEVAGVLSLPILVRGAEGTRLRIMQLIENLQRQDLSPLDEARAYQEIIDAEGFTANVLAERLAISSQMVRERLRLLQDDVVADALAGGQIILTVARAIQQFPPAVSASLKERLARGETVTTTDIEMLRIRMTANGIINPRRKSRAIPTADPPDEIRPAAPPAQVLAAPSAVPPTVASPPEQSVSPTVVPSESGDLPTPVPARGRVGVPGSPVPIDDDEASPMESHPAARTALLRHFAAMLGKAITPARCHILAEVWRELERADDGGAWWADLYPFMREEVIGRDEPPPGD